MALGKLTSVHAAMCHLSNTMNNVYLMPQRAAMRIKCIHIGENGIWTCAMALIILSKQIQQHSHELAAMLCGVADDSGPKWERTA